MRTHVEHILRLVTIGSLAIAGIGVSAQSPASGTIQVSGPRPVDLVIAELQRRHGYAITYEDPIRVSPADLKNVTETIPANRRQGKQHFIPQGGTFTFSYKPPDSDSDESMHAVLNMLVQQYNSISTDAQFRVERTGRVFHVLPARRRAVNGQLQEARSPLDAQIEVPDGPRRAAEQLVAIRDALRAAGYPGIGIGQAPPSALPGNVAGGVHGETAREALVRLLGSSPYKVSWGLLCGPGPEVACMLNLRPLTKDQ